ncbi:MAG TPA: HIT domain-containing protein [Chthoniobacteraceae bacterium]|jgi:ATP adenylyltransferase
MDLKELSALWAPWRVEYFSKKATPDFLREAAQTTDDAAHFVVARRKSCFLLMNRYPYAVGHMMAVPYRQVADLEELTDGEQLDLLGLAIHAQKLLRATVSAQGFNVGLNLGKCAGAGVADHLHLHIVPRWEGDNNFMPVLADTRVLPEALEQLYARLMNVEATTG